MSGRSSEERGMVGGGGERTAEGSEGLMQRLSREEVRSSGGVPYLLTHSASVVTLQGRDGPISQMGGGAASDEVHLRGAGLPRKRSKSLTLPDS